MERRGEGEEEASNSLKLGPKFGPSGIVRIWKGSTLVPFLGQSCISKKGVTRRKKGFFNGLFNGFLKKVFNRLMSFRQNILMNGWLGALRKTAARTCKLTQTKRDKLLVHE